ncbi:MAG: pyruvate, phosphate dikinase [Alphaproteobacteria bacterium]|nr:pyruvate, phosphate dikinase [Alphaproteobacteria bacterium]
MSQWVLRFGDGKAEGSAAMRDLLGGKGANLAEMCNLGLPVPPGLTITTEVCAAYYGNGRTYPEALRRQVADGVGWIESVVGSRFGDTEDPLLVSVRSGARVSMPGMMDTVLNLGLCDRTVEGLAKRSGDRRFAYDSYRRFIQMYGDVVLGVEHHRFEDILESHKEERGATYDTDLSAADLESLVGQYKALVKDVLGRDFPQDVGEQLWGAIGAVFASWMNNRAITYRKLHAIPESWGTAVNVQAMVFGNMGADCATGVAFTRNPSTGTREFYGEFLVNAQGEDVVAGIRTPQSLTMAGKASNGDTAAAMEEAMPKVFKELEAVRRRLEAHYRDMQDIEFTVQRGKLYMLQTRSGKRTAQAALRIAVEMVAEGLLSEAEAVARIDPAALDQLLHPTLDPKAKRDVLTRGLPASPGAVSGLVAFTADEAQDQAAQGRAVILVRSETSPEDIHGMHAARGILTARGGMTSHAAVVARGMGRPCVSGAGEIRVDEAKAEFSVRGRILRRGDTITIDGSTGEVMAGEVPTIQPELSGHFAKIMEWADQHRTMKVRTNAETPADARTARRFGAEGIGLCRTEHMFFDAERIIAVREMILADDVARRRTALAKILPMQRNDFVELFEIMAGLPVTIRLLDPPLHEFLPTTPEEMASVAKSAGVTVDAVRHRAAMLKEANPMLGHRGCRLGISYPEIYEMQARAIFEAAIEVKRRHGAAVVPEVMIPLVATRAELDILKARIDAVAREVMAESGTTIDYLVGTMIELPRAALQAGDIALAAAFFSFGTNDLTQTTFGISRDDAANFLDDYMRAGILERDPFVTLDQEGVGELVRIAAERGRRARPDLKLGICGEHGGDPASIRFCQSVGLDYVSCSPFRVPIARLAAAQAALATQRPPAKKASGKAA